MIRENAWQGNLYLANTHKFHYLTKKQKKPDDPTIKKGTQRFKDKEGRPSIVANRMNAFEIYFA